MPRSRYDNIDPEKKAQLLEAAVEEFGRYGYELASINRILEAARFSKGSFYYYFDDKADLAATTLLAVAAPELAAQQLELPDSAEGFWSELRRAGLAKLQQMQARRAEYDCLTRLSSALAADPALAAKVLPVFEPSRRALAHFLERGVALGALRSDVPLGLLLALIENAKLTAYQSMFPDGRVPSMAELESFSDLVLDLSRRLAAPAPPKG
ncbi:MAG: TetR/AcrR family transcriptional regulator [Myxococcus sp.]|nr:TetR/AcrR family transcriptional regulator [Myxococcus sp.]